jgi:RNA polymerase sigma factor (sigma-70 family)
LPDRNNSQPLFNQRERFNTLVEPHVMAMLRVAAVIIGASNAEDAVQEALIKAWQSLSSLRDAQLIHAWLLRITVNVCRDWQREKYNKLGKVLLSLDDIGEANVTLVGGTGSENHASLLDLRQALRSLDPEMQLIILLRYYAGENASEIGLILSIPASTVRTRLSRAIAKLRDILDHLDTGLSLGGADE